ncbi:MAG: undecaprenyl-diphosphate phosphatase [Vampirovibrionales bacterium]|nr:undecaprenyl-diphosphate phosphatase [Vampirovibrionales bacterium]
MDIGHALVKAVLQGLTEFLPVSSTAHLIFTDALFKLYGWSERTLLGEDEFYDILLHVGTLLAVLFYFRRDLTAIFYTMIGQTNKLDVPQHLGKFDLKQLPWQGILTTITTMIFIVVMLFGSKLVMGAMGWTSAHIHDLSDFYLAHPHWVAIHLMVTGGLLWFTDSYASRRQGEGAPLTSKRAIIVGLFQGVAAIFHGISRSGSTISGGLVSGLDRLTATRYAFIISIPIFIIAPLYDYWKMRDMGLDGHFNWPVMLTGVAVSAIVGYFCIKYFIRYVATHGLKAFAIYCWAMGLLMLALFATRGFNSIALLIR